MGKKLNRLLGRGLRVTKFKPTLSLAVSRLSVLKNQRTVRCSQARADVVQLLQLGHQERALLRVEQVIKEQNMVDAYSMMESYINLLIERANLMETEKECPEELKEAVSTICFASSRCGEFPELQEIRAAFQSHYGKEFVARAVELRNNCGVSTKMIQKMSTIMPVLEIRTKLLKQIAAENNITLNLDEPSPSSYGCEGGTGSVDDDTIKGSFHESNIERAGSSDSASLKIRQQKYKDVADAAQAAFEGAEYAAAAARAAVELSRMGGPQTPGGAGSSSSSPFGSEDEPVGKAQELKQKSVSKKMLSRTRSTSSRSSSGGEEEEEENGDETMIAPIPSRYRAGGGLNDVEEDRESAPPRLNLDKAPLSMRTRQVRGY